MSALRTLLARAARARRGDDGISLAELLVAMMVFAILMAITGGFMVSAMRASTQARAIDESTRTATNAMTAMTRNLRAATDNPVKDVNLPAPAFETLLGSEVVFYAYVNLASSDATPVKVRYWLDGRSLKESTTQSRRTVAGFFLFTGTTTTRTVATSVVTGTNLFAPVGATGADLPLATLTTEAALRQVAAVRVRVQVGDSATSPTATTLVNTVGLPNLDLARTL
ncbi:PulJ/GspJ family protein [Frigoribacterium salinisoli]